MSEWYQSPYELAGAAFGFLGVWLTVKQNVWCWPVGLVNVLLYAVVFYESRLYPDMTLQCIYAVLSLYGWYHWLHPGEGRVELPVTRITRKEVLALMPVGAAGAAAVGGFFATYTNADLPYLNSTTVVMSLIAQWLQTRKILENWALWIAADLVAIGVYLYKDLYATAALFAAYTTLAALGLREWRKSSREGVSSRG